MLVADLAASTPNQAYVACVQQVWSFVKAIEVISLPPNRGYAGYANATAPFLKTKTDAIQWVNKFYPACLQLPQQIIDDGQQVTPQLSTLVAAAQQLQSQPGNSALQSAISKSAQALGSIISGLLGQANSLVQALQGFAGAIVQDAQAQSSALHQVSNDQTELIVQLHALYGRLHGLTNTPCPNQSDISSCEQQIQGVQDQLNTTSQLTAVLGQARNSTAGALQGLQYLATYWASAVSSTQATLKALQAVASAPVNVLQVDLAAAQNAWDQILAFAQATVTQIVSAMPRAA